jgi:chromosome partitioning protein
MRTIAVMNQKGGVGKTTTTVNLGAALAELGQRVLLIDVDPQTHLSINFGIDPAPDRLGLYNVLIDDTPIAQAICRISDRIAVVPSSIDLAAAEVELVSVLGRESLLRKKMAGLGRDESEKSEKGVKEEGDLAFDYVLLDCPPSLGLLTVNALAAADEVIVPMLPHFLAMQGVAKLFETVQLVNRRMNPGLSISGIVFTMFDAQTKLSGEVVAELTSFIEAARDKPLPWAATKIFETRIRRNIKLAESPSFGQSVLEYESTSNGAADYRALAREVIAMNVPAKVIAPENAPVSITP